MIDRLYVARGDKTLGPFSAPHHGGMAAAGQLQLTDAVGRHGAMEKVVFAAKVKNLFPSPQVRTAGEGHGAAEAGEPTPAPTAGGPAAPGPALIVPSAPPPAPSDGLVQSDETRPAPAAPPGSAPRDSAAALCAADPGSHAIVRGGNTPWRNHTFSVCIVYIDRGVEQPGSSQGS